MFALVAADVHRTSAFRWVRPRRTLIFSPREKMQIESDHRSAHAGHRNRTPGTKMDLLHNNATDPIFCRADIFFPSMQLQIPLLIFCHYPWYNVKKYNHGGICHGRFWSSFPHSTQWLPQGRCHCIYLKNRAAAPFSAAGI